MDSENARFTPASWQLRMHWTRVTIKFYGSIERHLSFSLLENSRLRQHHRVHVIISVKFVPVKAIIREKERVA